MEENSLQYLQAVLNKDRAEAESIIAWLIEELDHDLIKIFKILSEVQVEIGELWAKNIITAADEHFATPVTLDMISFSSNKVGRSETRAGSAVMLSCVEGEFHYVGLKMFAEILAKEGWDVQFLGQSLPVRHIVDTLKKKGSKIDLICLSVTILFNLSSLIETIRALRRETLLKDVTIIVGGRVFRSKKIRAVIKGDSRDRLADFVAADIKDALIFLSKLRTKRRKREIILQEPGLADST